MRFWNRVLFALALSVAPAAADDGDFALPPVAYPKLAPHAANVDAIVPSGWKIEQRAVGDLNGDGLPDVALTLRDQDPRNVVVKSGPDGPTRYNTNPCVLVVLFAAAKGGYDLAVENRTLIPRLKNLYDEDDPTQIEFLAIKHGLLGVGFQYLAHGPSNFTVRFRYSQGHFLLVGYDDNGVTGGILSSRSIDFLSGRVKFSSGDVSSSKLLKERWMTFKPDPPLTMDQVGDATAFKPAGIPEE